MSGRSHRLWAYATFLIVFCLFSLPAQAEKTFNAESFYLKNGMKVVVIPNHRSPVVSHMVWYKVGAADEPAGKSGIAHFLEHLMFKGTKKIPDGHFSKQVKRMGGNDNAFTSQDFTAYYQNIAKDKLPDVMRMEADRMQNLTMTKEQVLSERDVIVEERLQRIDNHPQGRFQEQIMSHLYPNHPYSIPVIGWEHEIKQLTRQDALDFYKQYYAPNNAILIVAGDITAAELRPLATEIYGKIKKSKNIPPRTRPKPAPLIGETRFILKDSQVGRPMLQKIWRAERGQEALQILSEILGGSTTSRLYSKLVVNQKLAVSISSSYDAVSLDETTFAIYATPAPDVTPEQLEQAIIGEIKTLIEKGITEEELKSAQDRAQAATTYFLDSLQGPALIFGRALTSGFDMDYPEYWRDRIGALTVEDINKAADKVFTDIPAPVTGLLLPATPEPAADKEGGTK